MRAWVALLWMSAQPLTRTVAMEDELQVRRPAPDEPRRCSSGAVEADTTGDHFVSGDFVSGDFVSGDFVSVDFVGGLSLLQSLAGARRASASVSARAASAVDTAADISSDPEVAKLAKKENLTSARGTESTQSANSPIPAGRHAWTWVPGQDLNLSVSELFDQLPMHRVVGMLWQASPSSVSRANGTATAAFSEKKVDLNIILLGVFLLALCYGLVLLCLSYERQQKENEDPAKYQPPGGKSWPAVPESICAQVPPALSSKTLFRTHDLPLLIPLKRFRLRHLFNTYYSRSIHIMGSSGKKLFALHPREVERHVQGQRVIEVRELGADGHEGELLAAITSDLQVMGSHGTKFGKLINAAGLEYVLKEASGGEPRWVVTAIPNAGDGLPDFNVTLRPQNRLLATASTRHDHNADHLEVMTLQGVDGILVFTCIVGLISFCFAPQETSRTSLMHDVTEELGTSAARLLQEIER